LYTNAKFYKQADTKPQATKPQATKPQATKPQAISHKPNDD